MPDGFTGSFFISVQNACNNTLGQNGQGVCGVNLHFNHEYLGDLSITLTSPGGQSVTLVGPIGFFGPTDFTEWDVSFVPCADPATPDPGFSATWNNNQAWGLNGNYSGSYYPRTGCLENFNMGPVNGTWTLTVVDGQAVDVGNFLDYEIIFCDPSCIDCFSCAANAGQLPQPDVTACEGSTALDLNLPPSYSPPNVAPPASDYSYTYVIGGAGGVLLDYDPGANLTTYDPGVYTVCGMSYLTADAADLPVPDGVLTINTLRTQLNSTTPPLCGKITTNCVNVTITAAPEDEEQIESICAPSCFFFEGQNYCQSGTYSVTLTNAQGCTHIKTLVLTVGQPSNTNISETICAGSCSSNPLFPTACSAGLFTEIVENASGCDSTVRLTVTVLSAIANIANMPVVPCGGGTVQLQGTGSSIGGGISYLWTATNGGNIVGGATAINANINAAGTYELRVCRIANGISCCDSATIDIAAQTDPPNPPAQIIGVNPLCQGQTLNYTIAPVTGATSYTWTVPTGVTVNSGGTGTNINVTWNSPDPGDICVTANNACGPSDPTCLSIDVNAIPVATQPQGPTTVCNGTTTTYSIPTVANATNYIWTVTTPAQIVSGQGTEEVEISWNGGSSANLCVRAGNICGNSPQVCLPITIGNQPLTPLVNGSATICAGAVSTYTLTNTTGATSFQWEVTGGTITGGNGSTNVQVTWNANATSGTVCAVAVNSCGESAQVCFDVTLTPAPLQPTINGAASLCAGTTTTYSIDPIPGASGYTWTVPAGGVIVSGQNTIAISVNWPTAVSGNVCVTANSNCGTSPQQCFPVVINAVPNATAGADQSLCGTTATLSANTNVGTGLWTTVSGPGTATFSDPTAAATSVSVNQNGTYIFRWTATNVTCADDDDVQISFNPSPVAGAIMPQCDGANENYTISFPISGGTGPYSVAGGTVSNGIFTSAAIVSGTPYSFIVNDINGCQSAAITGSFNCNCATNAGTMTLMQLEACENQTVTAQTNGNANLDANDIGAYYLHQGAGTTLVGVLAQNTTGTFGFLPGMNYEQVYYISYVVGNNAAGFPAQNDPCLSVAQGQPVVFHQNPNSNAGADNAICGLSLALNGSTGIGAGTWSIVSTPSGGTLNIADQTNPTTTATGTLPGNYTVAWTVNNSGCTATDQVVLTFNESPSAGQISSDCDGTNTTYTVVFPIQNGVGPYTVNGVAVSGNTFTSNSLASGAPYSFILADANGCQSAALTGAVNCNCSTDAGTMTLTTLTTCEGGNITAEHQTGSETLDADDIGAYVLHEGSGTSLFNPIATNTTGTFTFQSGMTYGQTYYVSYVVGNNLAGVPNPADPCLSVAQGQPVVFYENPIANAGAVQQTCGTALNLGATGTGTWSITASPAGGTLTLADPNDPATSVSASLSGTYTITWAISANGCVGAANTEVTFHPSPNLGSLNRDCDLANENFTVTLVLAGGTAPYTINGTTINGSSFTSAALINGASYSFNIEDVNGCTMPAVTGAYSCNCATDAGTMSIAQLTACETDMVTAVANNDAALDANDITAFVLHEGSGPVIANAIAQNTTGIFSFNAATMSYGTVYYISRIAGNPLGSLPNPADPCFSVADGQPVVWLKNPTPNAGTDLQTCGTDLSLSATQGSFGGQWTLMTGAPGTAVFTDANSVVSSVTVSQTGIYTFRWTETNNICTGFDEVLATFNEVPAVNALDETCNSTNTQYSVAFDVTGGSAPYTVTGATGSFAGNTFTSGPITTNATYNLIVTDSKGCSVGPITGIKNCNCFTDAGSMQTTVQIFCAGDTAQGVWNNDASLDGDDIVRFILHNGSGGTVGSQVFATAGTPVFAFNNTLQIGVTYYISAICGNGSNGLIDLNDPCLSVAPGAPVRWKAQPTADLTGDATICDGESATLTFSGTGSYPLTLSYNNGSGNATFTLTAPSATLPVSPLTTTQYILSNVTDGSLPNCSVDLNELAVVTVNAAVDAGTALAAAEICKETPAIVALSTLLTGAEPGGTWASADLVTPAGFNAANGTFNTNQVAAGQYTFRYTRKGTAPCPDDATTVAVIVHPQPVADAGQDKIIDCITTEVTLGGGNTSTGAGTVYAWSNGSDQRMPVLTAGGTFTLTVTNSFGCTATDAASIVLNNSVPNIETIAVQGESCAGETDGVIEVTSLLSGTPPFEYILSGFQPSATGFFAGLDPGIYTLEVRDANGCTTTKDNIEVTAAQPLTLDLGPDLELLLGDSATVQLQISVPTSALDTIIWDPVLDAANAGKPVQHFFPIRSDDVLVTVVDSNGCRATDRLYFFVDTRRHIYVPNIFNAAGSDNNVVTVYGGRDVAEIELFRIYDRWGEELWHEANFQPNDETKGWTGTFRNKAALPGVYVWTVVVLFKDGERELFTGDVTVLR